MPYGWDRGRKFDRLDDGEFAFLEGACEVDVRELLAKVGRGGEELDQAVLDHDFAVGTLRDGLLHHAAGRDIERFTTAVCTPSQPVSIISFQQTPLSLENRSAGESDVGKRLTASEGSAPGRPSRWSEAHRRGRRYKTRAATRRAP